MGFLNQAKEQGLGAAKWLAGKVLPKVNTLAGSAANIEGTLSRAYGAYSAGKWGEFWNTSLKGATWANATADQAALAHLKSMQSGVLWGAGIGGALGLGKGVYDYQQGNTNLAGIASNTIMGGLQGAAVGGIYRGFRPKMFGKAQMASNGALNQVSGSNKVLTPGRLKAMSAKFNSWM